MRRAALVTALALALAAGDARAAYDPQLEVRVDPAAPGAPAALTATVTQQPGESATQSERVRFPPAFGFNPGLRVARCTAADEHAARCPDASRIGTATAETMLGAFAGTVHLTSDFRFVTFLRGFGGLVQQEVSGYLLLEPDGSVESVLDGLPDVPATLARVAFDAGPRSLLLTPRTCGRHVLTAEFTSHGGDRVGRQAAVEIRGCDSAPRIARAAAAARGRRATLSWQLTDAGSATLVDVLRVERAGRFDRLRRVRRIRAAATAGAHRLVLSKLARGRYQLVLRALSAGGRATHVARVALVVR